MDGYTLTKEWFAFASKETDCTPMHTATYMLLVEMNNQTGWTEDFEAEMRAMKKILRMSRRTLKTVLDDFENWQIIKTIPAKNQYQKMRIALSHFAYAKSAIAKNAYAKSDKANQSAYAHFAQANCAALYNNKINNNKNSGENAPARTREEILKNNFFLENAEADAFQEKKKTCAQKRKEDFRRSVLAFPQYPDEMLEDFFGYWSETNEQGVMRFELQPTWSTAYRLDKWIKKEKRMQDEQTVRKLQAATGYHSDENLDYSVPL